jgi:hypothetical protein
MAFCSPTFLRLRETAARFLPAQTQKRRQPFIVICHTPCIICEYFGKYFAQNINKFFGGFYEEFCFWNGFGVVDYFLCGYNMGTR